MFFTGWHGQPASAVMSALGSQELQGQFWSAQAEIPTDLSWSCTLHFSYFSLFAFLFFICPSLPFPTFFFFFNGIPLGFLFQLFDKELMAYRWHLSKKDVPQMMSSCTCLWVLFIYLTLCLISLMVTWSSPRLQRAENGVGMWKNNFYFLSSHELLILNTYSKWKIFKILLGAKNGLGKACENIHGNLCPGGNTVFEI